MLAGAPTSRSVVVNTVPPPTKKGDFNFGAEDELCAASTNAQR